MMLLLSAALAAPSPLAPDTVYIMDCGGTQASIVARYSPSRGLEAMNRPPAELEALGPALTAAFGVGTQPLVKSVWVDGGAADPSLLVVGKCRGGVFATVPLTPLYPPAPVPSEVFLDSVARAQVLQRASFLSSASVSEPVPGIREVRLFESRGPLTWSSWLLLDPAGAPLTTLTPAAGDPHPGSTTHWFSFESRSGVHQLGVMEASVQEGSGNAVVVIRPDGRAQTIYTVVNMGDGC